MWPDRDAARAVRGAMSAVASESSEAAHAEVFLKRSRGRGLRRGRALPTEASDWTEAALAVRVALGDGRAAVATSATWDRPEDTARDAVALAEAAGGADTSWVEPRAASCASPTPGRVDVEPPGAGVLRRWVSLVEEAALGVDRRVVALDTSLLRVAVVESFLATTDGVALHQRQLATHAHATVVVRDGLRVLGHADGWAGSVLRRGEAVAFGARLGAAAVADLAGLAAIPQSGALLLRPAAVADLTFALAPILLGLQRGATARRRLRSAAIDPRLRLTEDSLTDARSRVVAADGAGAALVPVALIRRGRVRPHGANRAPFVRPGVGDVPMPGWLRLSWSWAGGGLANDDLLHGLRTGFVVESASTLSLDPRSLAWSASAAGRWIEHGRPRHAVARVPLRLDVAELLQGIIAAGADTASAHASGTVRAPSLLVRELKLGG